MPSMSSVSLIDPPCFFSTLTLSTSTFHFLPSFSATAFIALTTISESASLRSPADLPVMEVCAIFFRVSSSLISTFMDMLFRVSVDFSAASLNPSVIRVGCMFFSSRFSASFRSSPAKMTAVVVPSPHCSSWVFATSMIIFAAGLTTSISLRMVTPSFVMITSPMESTSILSIPFGPSVVLTASAIAFAAAMFLLWALFPLSLSVPSLRTNIGVPPIIFFHLIFPYRENPKCSLL